MRYEKISDTEIKEISECIITKKGIEEEIEIITAEIANVEARLQKFKDILAEFD